MATVDFRGQREQLNVRPQPVGQTTVAISGGSSLVEGLCGLAVGVLAIIALFEVYPLTLSGIAQIVYGVGLLFASNSSATFFARLWDRPLFRNNPTVLSGSIGPEVMGGIAGIVLGALTIAGIYPIELSGAAAIVFGSSILIGCVTRARLNFMMERRGMLPDEEWDVFRVASTSGVGARLLTGAAALVLGILTVASVGTYPLTSLTLALAAFLSLGVVSLLTGGAFGGMLMTRVQQR